MALETPDPRKASTPPSSLSGSGPSAASTPSNAITLSPPAGFNRCRYGPIRSINARPIERPGSVRLREVRQADRPAGPSLREIQDPAAEVVVADPGGLRVLSISLRSRSEMSIRTALGSRARTSPAVSAQVVATILNSCPCCRSSRSMSSRGRSSPASSSTTWVGSSDESSPRRRPPRP